MIAQLVGIADKEGKTLAELPLEVYREISRSFEEDIFEVIDMKISLTLKILSVDRLRQKSSVKSLGLNKNYKLFQYKNYKEIRIKIKIFNININTIIKTLKEKIMKKQLTKINFICTFSCFANSKRCCLR